MTPQYDRVKLAVCLKEHESTTIRAAMAKLGIADAEICDNVETLSAVLDDGLFDLVICDYSMLGPDFLDMTKRVRRRKAGRNPFVIVIATFDTPSVETVRELVDVGVDDLLRSPLSLDRLLEGVEKFTRSRKPFVASYEYIGPTRRAAQRDNEDPISLIHIPNTLRSKVVLDVSDLDLQRMVDVAVVELEDKQLETRGHEIQDVATRLCTLWEQNAADMQIPALLDRLHGLSYEFQRLNEHGASAQIINLARMLVAITTRIKNDRATRPETEVKLLLNLSQAIHRALTVERDAVELMKEIVETVATHTPD